MKKTSKKIKLSDVAALAGVGSATVDRVLHERGNVSEEVQKKVLQAARELGLKRILPTTYRKIIRVNVILARSERPLIRRMANEFRKQAQMLDRTLLIHRTILPDDAPEDIAEAMLKPGYDAIVVDAPEHPVIQNAIEVLDRKHIPVVTIISDVVDSKRLAFAGTDNYKAGRSAGYFMNLMLPGSPGGKVVILCHHEGFTCHADRIRGIKDQFASTKDGLQVVEILRGSDQPQLSETLLRAAFQRHPDLLGIYNAGGANRGVIAAMKSGILARKPTFIGHELTPFTFECLNNGMMMLTIDQSPELQVQYALDVLMNHFGFEGATHAEPPYVSNVPIVLYGPQNLPDVPPETNMD